MKERDDRNLFPIEGFVAYRTQRPVIFLQRPSKFAMLRGPGHVKWRRLCFLSGQHLLSHPYLCFLALLLTSSTKHS